MTDPAQPTAEDLQKGGQVAQAAAVAVQESSTEADARKNAKAAIESKAREVKLELSDEDATKIVDMLIERMAAMGAFDAPPAAPAASPAEVAAHATPEQAAAATAAADAAVAPPEKKTFAERFANL